MWYSKHEIVFTIPWVSEHFGGAVMSEREYDALRSALASTRMEGFDVTEQTEKDCVRLMTGELSVADMVKEILARPAKAVWYGI